MDDKTELLAKIDFLAEYQRIGIQFESTEPNAAGWVPYHSIDRDNRNASAAVNLQNGFYTDLGNGGRKLDFFVLMQILGGFRSFLEVAMCDSQCVLPHEDKNPRAQSLRS